MFTSLKGHEPKEGLHRAIFLQLETATKVKFRKSLDNDYLNNKIGAHTETAAEELETEISELEADGKNTAKEITEALKEKSEDVVRESFNRALVDINLQQMGQAITLDELLANSDTKDAAEGLFNENLAKYEKSIETAVESYFKAKSGASKDALEALGLVTPDPTKMPKQKENPRLDALQKQIRRREEIRNETRRGLDEMKSNPELVWMKHKNEIDSLTDPRRKGAEIRNYPGKWKNNVENPVRYQLNGLLYAEFVFAGRGSMGRDRAQRRFDNAVDLYKGTWSVGKGFYNRFEMKHLEVDMQLGDDTEVAAYSEYHSARGMMKGLLHLTRNAENLSDERKNDYIEKTLKPTFQTLTQHPKNEQKQLEILFKIDPPFEVDDIDPNWKTAWNTIDNITDNKNGGLPDGKNGDMYRITNYEGWDGPKNKVRANLNAYLYGSYIFYGQGKEGKKNMEDRYRHARTLYETRDDAWADVKFSRMFEQDHLDHEIGLSKYYKDASEFTKHEKVKTAIATLYQLVDSDFNSWRFNHDDTQKDKYREYLRRVFNELRDIADEDEQLMHLTKIKSPDAYMKLDAFGEQVEFLNVLKSALEQNRFYKFDLGNTNGNTNKFIAGKTKLPQEAVDSMELANAINFGTIEMTKAIADIDEKLEYMEKANAVRKTYSEDQMNSFKQRRQTMIDDFNSALGKSRGRKNMKDLVASNYLADLEETQIEYHNLAEDCDLAIQELQKPAEEKDDDQDGSGTVGGAVGGATGAEILSEGDDLYEKEWKNGENAESIFGQNKAGTYEVKTGTDKQAVMRNNTGKIIGKPIFNGTKVEVTAEQSKKPSWRVASKSFMLVTLNNQEVWISEDYLFRLSTAETAEEKDEKDKKEEKKEKEKEKEKKEAPEEKIPTDEIDRLFYFMEKDLETPPYRHEFVRLFNNDELYCTVTKRGGKYFLHYNADDVKAGSIKYDSLKDMKSDIRTGHFDRMLTEVQITDRSLWQKYARKENGLAKIGNKVNTFKKVAQNEAFLILDWRGIMKKKNPDIHVKVLRDGRISYTIERVKVAPDGGNKITGHAPHFDSLREQIAVAREHAENYRKNKRKSKKRS